MTNAERDKAIRLSHGESRNSLGIASIRSQSDVARLLGISRQAVYQAERMAILKLRTGLRTFWVDWKENRQ